MRPVARPLEVVAFAVALALIIAATWFWGYYTALGTFEWYPAYESQPEQPTRLIRAGGRRFPAPWERFWPLAGPEYVAGRQPAATGSLATLTALLRGDLLASSGAGALRTAPRPRDFLVQLGAETADPSGTHLPAVVPQHLEDL